MHSSSASLNPQPAGAQISLGSLVHPVMGVYFFTGFFSTVQTSLGHLEHLVLVVYPEVSSSHFSSTSVLQISGPCTSQSLTRGVLHISEVSLKAICSYSIKQLFLKFSSHSSSCCDS